MSINNRGKATPKTAFSSVLGTVTAMATTVSSVFETGADGIQMLNKYVADASEKQRIASDYDMATFEDALLKETAMEETKQLHTIKAFFKEDTANEEMYKTSFNRIQAAVNARRNPQAATK